MSAKTPAQDRLKNIRRAFKRNADGVQKMTVDDNNNNNATCIFDEAKKGEQGNACICERPARRVVCGVCAKTFSGRVSTKCEIHPRVAFLHDLEQCPNCKAIAIYLTEFNP